MAQPSSYHTLDADVIIIGAGIAGMTTAYALLEKEPYLHIMVLEASNRIGGRTSSKGLLVKNSEFHLFDFGGQWINSQQHLLHELMEELHIKTQQKDHTGKIIFDFCGKQYKESKNNPYSFCSLRAKLELADFIRTFETLCKRPVIRRELASRTMHQFIEENISHETNKAILKTMILVNCGLDAAHITVGFYIFYCISTHGITNQLTIDGGGLHEMWIKDGAQEICNKIAILLQRDIVIVPKTKVLEIMSTKTAVQVSSFDGVFFSRKVVVAVPPWAIAQISFEPPLPTTKLLALSKVVCGNLSKFVITYDEAFWRKMGYSGDIYILNEHSSHLPLVYCTETNVDDNPALTGFMIKTEGDPKIATLIQISRYFGRKALQPIYFGSKDWKGGSPICCYKSFEDVWHMMQKSDGVFWAGAETSVDWYGTMAGAVLSGFRAAHDVLYDIHPSIMSMTDIDQFSSDLYKLRKQNRSHEDIFKKATNPHYQLSAVVLLILAVIAWRKLGLTSYLRNILIKK